MPASQRSLRITEAYRARTVAIRERLQRLAAERWPTIEALDTTDWVDRMAAAVAQGQIEAVRASAGYLTAFLSSELGRRVRGPAPDSRSYAGFSRDGRALTQALQSPLIGVRARLSEGAEPSEALAHGRTRATRMVGVDLDHAARTSLLKAIDADERFEGWQRAVQGTCGACAGVATGPSGGLLFEVHPGCQCVSEPIVARVRDAFPRATGAAIFAAKSKAEQDEMLSPEAADLVRKGDISLADLVERSRLETQDDFITQRPIEALPAT